MARFANVFPTCNHRRVTFLGSVLCSTGMALSAAAPSMVALFCSMGLLTGLGLGLSTTPGIILTARYFTANRAKANSLCLSGASAGSFCLPFLIEVRLRPRHEETPS